MVVLANGDVEAVVVHRQEVAGPVCWLRSRDQDLEAIVFVVLDLFGTKARGEGDRGSHREGVETHRLHLHVREGRTAPASGQPVGVVRGNGKAVVLGVRAVAADLGERRLEIEDRDHRACGVVGERHARCIREDREQALETIDRVLLGRRSVRAVSDGRGSRLMQGLDEPMPGGVRGEGFELRARVFDRRRGLQRG